jgi:hypothetical protein
MSLQSKVFIYGYLTWILGVSVFAVYDAGFHRSGWVVIFIGSAVMVFGRKLVKP